MPFFTTLPKTTLPSFSVCLYFLKYSPSLVKTVSSVKTWLWFGFRKSMSHAGLFPCSGLPSGLFALTCVLLGLLYPHYWLQVMFWTQPRWPQRRLDTSLPAEGPLETWHRLLNPSTKCSGHKHLSCLAWSQSMRFSRFNCERGNAGHASHTNVHASAAVFPEWSSMQRIILNYLTFSSCLLIRNLNMQSCLHWA